MLTAYFCMFSIAGLPRLMNGQESTKNKQFNSRLISSNTVLNVCAYLFHASRLLTHGRGEGSCSEIIHIMWARNAGPKAQLHHKWGWVGWLWTEKNSNMTTTTPFGVEKESEIPRAIHSTKLLLFLLQMKWDRMDYVTFFEASSRKYRA